MMKNIITLNLLAVVCAGPAFSQEPCQADTIETASGELKISFLGHGTLMFHWKGKTIHVDPFSQVADYSKLPKADLLFITHDHFDHMDPDALKQIRTERTVVVGSKKVAEKVQGTRVVNDGDELTVEDIRVEAVPAYNIVNKRDNGEPYHPKGEGNGYIFTFGDKRIYVAGDTENTPEMKALKDIDVAFLPMNLPYTMTPEMEAQAATAFKPKVLYPYHFGETDTNQLVQLLKDTPEIEVRIRDMK